METVLLDEDQQLRRVVECVYGLFVLYFFFVHMFLFFVFFVDVLSGDR